MNRALEFSLNDLLFILWRDCLPFSRCRRQYSRMEIPLRAASPSLCGQYRASSASGFPAASHRQAMEVSVYQKGEETRERIGQVHVRMGAEFSKTDATGPNAPSNHKVSLDDLLRHTPR